MDSAVPSAWLITPYRRIEVARDESSVNRSPAAAEVIEGLNDLLQLDHDAIGAYEIAIEHLEDRDHAAMIEGFRGDHERHVRALNELIVWLGGAPANEPHATAPLKQAIQRIAAKGGDQAILAAWRANELQVRTKYDRYAQKAIHWPRDAKRLVDENALDEERHYDWIVGVMGDEAPEVDAANRVREEMVRVRQYTEKAQERAGSFVDTARIRTAEGLEDLAAQLEEIADRTQGEEGLRGRAAEGAQRLAAGLDSTAEMLREGGGGDGSGVEELRVAVEDEVRRSPARALLATFAVGFVIGRIVR